MLSDVVLNKEGVQHLIVLTSPLNEYSNVVGLVCPYVTNHIKVALSFSINRFPTKKNVYGISIYIYYDKCL